MATNTEHMTRVAEAMVEVFKHEREREARELHQRRLIAACVRDFKDRRYQKWHETAALMGLRGCSRNDFRKLLLKTKPRALPCSRVRLMTLQLLESHGYDIFALYRCPPAAQRWRHRDVERWAQSRSHWRRLMQQRGCSIRDPEQVLHAA